MKQFEWAKDPARSLILARSMVSGKIKNCRTLLRRNCPEFPEEVLESLARLSMEAEKATGIDSLLGIEGAAAEIYFSNLGKMLKGCRDFFFQNRNKRPPKDPVNAVLSYLYGILAKELFVTVLAVGFDPYLGFYHQPRYGRPALALDMMEEFRPVIADSVTINLFNNKELAKRDFIRTGLGVSMTPEAKRKVVAGYERRIETEITHPLFSYMVSYRRVLEMQARLLSRVLLGELKDYPAFFRR
jgi:CRISPR-associated protein Cas1